MNRGCSQTLFIFLWSSFIFASFTLSAAEKTIFSAETRAEKISEASEAPDDIRQKLLAIAQRDLVKKAVKELMVSSAFSFYEKEIRTNFLENPQQYLLSIKIIEEKTSEKVTYVRLQGEVNLKILKDHLNQNGLPLKGNSFRNITLLFQDNPYLSRQFFKRHLRLLGINPRQEEKIPKGFENSEEVSATLIAKLLQEYPQNNVIYFTRFILLEGLPIFEILVLKKGWDSPFVRLLVKLGQNNKKAFANKILRHLSLRSLKVNSYVLVPEEAVFLFVKGLSSPLEIAYFEEALGENSAIQTYNLAHFRSNMEMTYRLVIRKDISRFVDILMKYPKLKVEIKRIDERQVEVEVRPENFETALPLQPFVPFDTLEEWDNILQRHPALQVPKLQEQEENDSFIRYNSGKKGQNIIGELDSRRDEDIFFFEVWQAQQIQIQLLNLMATTYNPQLKIYNQQHELLATYSNLTFRKLQNFRYRFKNPQNGGVFIRIYDKIGFIRQERGRKQKYHYILNIQ